MSQQQEYLVVHKMADTKIIAGIIGVFALLGTGVYFILPEQLDNTYVCTTNNITVIADRLSTTSKTAYWSDNGTDKSLVCKNGMWIKLSEFTKNNNILIDDLINSGIPINEEIPKEQLIYTEKDYEDISVDGVSKKLFKYKKTAINEVEEYCKDKPKNDFCYPCYMKLECNDFNECVCVRE